MPVKDGLAAAFEIRELEAQHQWPRHRIVRNHPLLESSHVLTDTATPLQIALTSLSNSVDRDRALDGPSTSSLTTCLTAHLPGVNSQWTHGKSRVGRVSKQSRPSWRRSNLRFDSGFREVGRLH